MFGRMQDILSRRLCCNDNFISLAGCGLNAIIIRHRMLLSASVIPDRPSFLPISNFRSSCGGLLDNISGSMVNNSFVLPITIYFVKASRFHHRPSASDRSRTCSHRSPSIRPSQTSRLSPNSVVRFDRLQSRLWLSRVFGQRIPPSPPS